MLQASGRARGVSLRALFPAARLLRAEDIRATRVSTEAKRCRANDLFVAVTGDVRDGHDDVEVALDRGASAVLTERLLSIDVPQCIVSDSREALGELSHELAGRPTAALQTLGVAGTQGKTVVTHLLASVIAATRQTCGVMSTIGYSDSLEQVTADETTPAAPELAQWLARMTAAGTHRAVVEVSRTALAQRRLAGTQFDALTLTSLRPAATDDVGPLATEQRLYSRLCEQLKPGGFVVANADDAQLRAVVNKLSVPVMTYGLREEASVTATIPERHAGQQTFLIHAGHETIAVSTGMIGDHHVLNCLAATAMGLTLGIDLPTIVRGLESQRYMPGRLQRLDCGQPFHVFVDYARTPEMLAASLKTVRQTTTGRVWCVLGVPGDQNKKLRPQLGRVVERLADKIILTSDNPRREEPLVIAHDILDGMTDVGAPRILPDRTRAIEWALSQARPGDAVVIAGKGDEDWQIVGRKRQSHDDREIACKWLYQNAAEIEPVAIAGRIGSRSKFAG